MDSDEARILAIAKDIKKIVEKGGSAQEINNRIEDLRPFVEDR